MTWAGSCRTHARHAHTCVCMHDIDMSWWVAEQGGANLAQRGVCCAALAYCEGCCTAYPACLIFDQVFGLVLTIGVNV